MTTYQANQEDTSYTSMNRDSKFESQKEVQRKLNNIKSNEIESRPTEQVPTFIMRVMLTSMVAFLVAVGLETFVLHTNNLEINLARRIIILSIASSLLGGVLGMITGFVYVMKKEFNFKNAMTIMGVMLIILMVGIAILGDNPILSQYMTN
ncbi:hypothetical protein Fleli_2641 [Bernardetia litoralis DSM 6794]|uniref:Uncharacterized protein n=1 Tax=Bernardetia litoralis (strain ATCC 23117 / DSM 6794 / NBRC 15988 / NCIMB 1366 / Fx l1 / Sio-4) TaxID=880071 RepID=I4AM17_BERLS|nr:hypothetical protein [Bernardetia litoralis]AFM05002.1 hypothetical protein Fleli_2641 [Bernardetia litoralis DSM 6794]